MSDPMIRLLWFGMLLAHGLGHGGALGALAWVASRPEIGSGSWTAASSWLLPSMTPGTATLVASAFWVVSLVGFVAAAFLFWFAAGDGWKPVAIGSALVSTVGIVLFFGTWPPFNTVAALAVNGIVLVALLVVRWTPPAA